MGLSTKQVSCDGLEVGWGRQAFLPAGVATPPQVKVIEQQQQQKEDPLKCPRCASTNTKFCYYNNYNRSQPRHFCKSCRRHWTQGGTLREIPVGGGRKNRRLKSSTNNPNSNSRGHHGTNTNAATRPGQDLSLSLGSQKNHSETPNKSLLHLSSSLPLQFQPVRVNNYGNSESNKFSVNSNNFTGSYTHSSICNFPFTKSSTFDSNSPSIAVAFPSSDMFSYSTGHAGTLAEPITTTVAGGTNTTMNPYWQCPVTSSFLDWTSNWSWDDLTTLVSTDFKQSWDDSQNESQGI